MSPDTYVAALTMLARRELSEAQIRQRLARRQHPPEAIDAAVARLIADRSLDDARVAGAIARSEVHLKKRGRQRVRRAIEAAGISSALARQTVDEVFGGIDPEALLSAAIARRLRGRERPADRREFERLVRYLVGQGFDVDQVVSRLAALRPESGS